MQNLYLFYVIIIHDQRRVTSDYMLLSPFFQFFCVSITHAINHVFIPPCWEFI